MKTLLRFKALAVMVILISGLTAAYALANPESFLVRTSLYSDGTFFQPLQLADNLITTDPATGAKTAALTAEGTLILKPSEEAGISLTFRANTKVTGEASWAGDIDPPLIQSKSIIQEDPDYEIEGTRRTLEQGEAETVIQLSSKSFSLTLSVPARVSVPVSLGTGAVVQMYSSEGGLLWERLGAPMVTQNSQVKFNVDQLTHYYFALVPTGEITSVIPEETLPEEVSSIEELPPPPARETPVLKFPFWDTYSHWSREYVSKLYGLKVVSGKTSRTFAPNDLISRAELAKIALLAFGIQVPPEAITERPFKDAPKEVWYTPYLKVAKEQGIAEGYPDGTFKPQKWVSRAEALKVLLKAAKVTIDPALQGSFNDVVSSDWYYPYVVYSKAKGIVEGYADGLFHPDTTITRGEAAKMVVKILETK